ncbi:MAG: Bax inhibitor-1/YccA family protein [Actinomycetaceae bacterium]|nr:Bax inhibitor-1/YccA family protein [Actinomycetaceae bacterium]
MSRNPYFRQPGTPNAFPASSSYGQQYDAYGQQGGYGQYAGPGSAQTQYDPYGQPVNQFGAQGYQNQYMAQPSGPFTPPGAGVNTMTYDDAMIKTVLMLGVVIVTGGLAAFLIPADVAGPLAFVSMFLAFGVAMFAAFRPMVSPGLALAYSVLEGVALGTVTAALEARYPGIALQAILGTMVVVAVAAGLHMSGKVRTSPRGRKIMLTIMVAAIVYGFVNLIIRMTGMSDRTFGMDSYEVGGVPIGVIFGLILIVVAGYMLISDLELVRYAVDNGAPKGFAWTVAFSITVTVVWIYVEVLRVLAILANSD